VRLGCCAYPALHGSVLRDDVFVANLVERLLHRSRRVREEALREAIADRAEEALAEALLRGDRWDRVMLAAVLGDFSAPGPADPALREAAATSGPGTQDLRCASLVSLTKRLGAAATPVLRAALTQRDAIVRDYAVTCLAAVGDAAAWPDVLIWLRGRRTRSRAVTDPATPAAAHYLLRHLPERSAQDRDHLAAAFRRAWPILEQDGVTEWLASVWPELQQPDSDHLRSMPREVDPDEWRRKPLFTATAMPRL
jgi:hypothetical protein